MPVLKVKLNGAWVEIDGVSGHTHDIDDITNLPTSFPANGGDADTLDGKHASDFTSSTDFESLKTLVGDETVSEQINSAIAQKSQVQIITWEADD